MKHFIQLLELLFCVTGVSHVALAQDSRESEIRRLEKLERESVLKGDSLALFDKIWSPKMIVNTPANVVGTVGGTKAHSLNNDENFKEHGHYIVIIDLGHFFFSLVH